MWGVDMSKSFLRWSLWGIVLVSLLALASDRGPLAAADKLPFARLMPRGALAYVQTKDLAGLLKTWRDSKTKENYFNSPSYRAFTQSRLYLELQERLREFEQGAGIEFTEDQAISMAGGQSAATLYDMGKVELVYISELPLAQATATMLFKQSPRFDSHRRGNFEYFVQELATDGGRLRQGLCFSASDGKLIITTTEPLMQRTLDNLINRSAADATDHLAGSMSPVLAVAQDFTPHDMTLWVDAPRLRDQRFFGTYWVQGKQANLSQVNTSLADLEFAPGGIWERRWVVLADDAAKQSAPQTGAVNLVSLLQFVPDEAQSVSASAIASAAQQAQLTTRLAKLIFPPLRPPIEPSNLSFSPPGYSEESDSADANQLERYRFLDQRFDQDVDDPASTLTGTKAKLTVPSFQQQLDSQFEKDLADILNRAKPTSFVQLGNVKPESSGGPFMQINQAIVVECGSSFDASRFEAAALQVLGGRLVVPGTAASFQWKALANGVRVPPTDLVQQGGAYQQVGNYVIFASRPEFCAAIAAQFQAKRQPVLLPETKTADRFAVVRLGAGREAYRRLMQQLEFVPSDTATEMGDEETGDGASGPNPFFSSNLNSLINVAGYVEDITLESSQKDRALTEVIRYRFSPTAPKAK